MSRGVFIYVNKIPRDTELYKLMTTTFGEAV